MGTNQQSVNQQTLSKYAPVSKPNIFIHILFHYRILNHYQLSINYAQYNNVKGILNLLRPSVQMNCLPHLGSQRIPLFAAVRPGCRLQVAGPEELFRRHVCRQDSVRDVSSSKTLVNGNCTMFKRQISYIGAVNSRIKVLQEDNFMVSHFQS